MKASVPPPLWIDKRVGSGELAPLLKGLPLVETLQDYGDFVFLGRGTNDEPVPVAVERKTILDLVNCVIDGRFADHQLPGLVQSYQEVWLVIEGIYRSGPKTGILEVPLGQGKWKPVEYGHRHFMYRELECLLITLEERAGIRVRQTSGKMGTAVFIRALYHWWTEKTFEEHRSHLRLRTPEADAALLTKPPLVREMAALLPGIGWKKSLAVAQKFQSPRKMANASWTDWLEIEGIGKTLATKIASALEGYDGAEAT